MSLPAQAAFEVPAVEARNMVGNFLDHAEAGRIATYDDFIELAQQGEIPLALAIGSLTVHHDMPTPQVKHPHIRDWQGLWRFSADTRLSSHATIVDTVLRSSRPLSLFKPQASRLDIPMHNAGLASAGSRHGRRWQDFVVINCAPSVKGVPGANKDILTGFLGVTHDLLQRLLVACDNHPETV